MARTQAETGRRGRGDPHRPQLVATALMVQEDRDGSEDDDRLEPLAQADHECGNTRGPQSLTFVGTRRVGTSCIAGASGSPTHCALGIWPPSAAPRWAKAQAGTVGGTFTDTLLASALARRDLKGETALALGMVVGARHGPGPRRFACDAPPLPWSKTTRWDHRGGL